MPLALFIGVNHHGQSILFYARLISSENIQIVVWLFRAWLKFMNGRALAVIITDQDCVLKSAIIIVFFRN